jgi:hypothetical protein
MINASLTGIRSVKTQNIIPSKAIVYARLTLDERQLMAARAGSNNPQCWI